MSRRALATASVVVLLAGAATLVAVEIAAGAATAGSLAIRDPCRPRPAFPGEGLDATLQRVVLDGLDGAACELGTSREALVLSLDPHGRVEPIPWDTDAIERAVRAGLLASIDDAEDRGSLSAPVAIALRAVVERAPLRWLIEGGRDLADLLGGGT